MARVRVFPDRPNHNPTQHKDHGTGGRVVQNPNGGNERTESDNLSKNSAAIFPASVGGTSASLAIAQERNSDGTATSNDKNQKESNTASEHCNRKTQCELSLLPFSPVVSSQESNVNGGAARSELDAIRQDAVKLLELGNWLEKKYRVPASPELYSQHNSGPRDPPSSLPNASETCVEPPECLDDSVRDAAILLVELRHPAEKIKHAPTLAPPSICPAALPVRSRTQRKFKHSFTERDLEFVTWLVNEYSQEGRINVPVSEAKVQPADSANNNYLGPSKAQSATEAAITQPTGINGQKKRRKGGFRLTKPKYGGARKARATAEAADGHEDNAACLDASSSICTVPTVSANIDCATDPAGHAAVTQAECTLPKPAASHTAQITSQNFPSSTEELSGCMLRSATTGPSAQPRGTKRQRDSSPPTGQHDSAPKRRRTVKNRSV